ncbi:hypothetical protein HS125_06380 [bacterium]|nr:hypothetical protein [bacterium]
MLHFARQWGMTAALPPLDADLDHDGAVDAGDLLLLLADWHATVHAGELGGSHAVHFDAVRGPGITGCTVCHVDNLTTHAPRDGIVHFADGKTLAETGVCNGCHGTTAQTKPIWGECVACADCHNGTHPGHGNPDGSGLAAPDKSGYFFTAGHGLASDSRYAHSGNAGAGLGSCLPCHDARPTTGRHISGVAGDYKRLRSVPSDDLAYTAPIAELCLSCHRPGQTVPGPLGRDATAEALPHSAGVSGHYGTISSAESAFPAYGDESDFALHPGFGCEVCHDAHGTANLGMIRAVVDGFLGGMSAPSSVTLTSASPGWVQTDGTGICEACHRAGGPAHPDTHHPGNHNLGSDCRLCHDNHTGSFQASASETSCLGCHGTAQGSRRAAGADFMLRSHHVVGGATDGDCRVCHDVSQHAGGTVRLIDYNQTGSVVEFTSDAALEPFCLGCHDADGAGGDTTPFSDGVPVQNVTTGWDAGAHKAAGVSCMGDGTTGCHGNGHGSRKKHLLAQPYTPPTAPGYVEEEEGFCYRCHGEVQGQFALASRHDVAYGDQAVEGGKVECVHCHNPHLATHQHPLVNPDSRANAWTGGETGFCLVCHDGAPPTGVAFPAQSPGSGYNKSRFVGTKHDGAGRTCGHCHAPHGSAQASLKSLRYDQLDSVVWSFGSAQYALCWQCHDEAKTVRSGSGANANNAFGTRHDKHVRGERASCIICHDVHAGYDAGEDGLISSPIR